MLQALPQQLTSESSESRESMLSRVAEILAVLTRLSATVDSSSSQISELRDITTKADSLITDVRTLVSERSVDSQTINSSFLAVGTFLFFLLS
jgi:hypothetical protein